MDRFYLVKANMIRRSSHRFNKLKKQWNLRANIIKNYAESDCPDSLEDSVLNY